MPSVSPTSILKSIVCVGLLTGLVSGCESGTGQALLADTDTREITFVSDVMPEPPEVPSRVEPVAVRTELDLRDVVPEIDAAEVETFEALMRRARNENVHTFPMDSLVQWVGVQFLGAPYVGGMLDAWDSEELVVSFRKFDCVLFIETVLAIADGIAAEDYSGSGFVRRLEDLRYRQGINSGYASRLHYFSEWMYDNASMGYVQDMTPEFGGTSRTKTLNMMSKHPRLYRRLRHNKGLRTEIANMERQLKDIPQYYVPQVRLPYAIGRIKAGDVVSTATVARGLDVSHSGFAFRNADGSIGLLHASSVSGKVIVTENLHDYVVDNRHTEGILIARPQRQ